MSDKNIEKSRYDDRARLLLERNTQVPKNSSRPYLTPPMQSYIDLLSKVREGARVLEIGAGMGENTKVLLDLGLNVVATDISPHSVDIMQKELGHYASFSSQVEDMEALSLADNSFDVVCSAGSLSYGDNLIVMDEIHRVLRSGGVFIALDSLGDNPIYNLNRYIHFIRGRRTRSTLQRMPTTALIVEYGAKFGSAEARFFGSLIWLCPLLCKVFSDRLVARWSEKFDLLIGTKKSAFKFTMKAVKT